MLAVDDVREAATERWAAEVSVFVCFSSLH